MSIVHKRIKGIVYVYDKKSFRDKKTKQPRSKWKLLGKLDEATGIIVSTGKNHNTQRVVVTNLPDTPCPITTTVTTTITTTQDKPQNQYPATTNDKNTRGDTGGININSGGQNMTPPREKTTAGITSAYKNIMNGPAMSTVQRVSGKDMHNMTNIDGKTEGHVNINDIEKGGIEITLGYSNILRLTPTSRKLLDLLLMRISEVAPYGEQATREAIARVFGITVRLEEYMSLCGLKDKRNAREQFREAAHTLLHLWVKFDYIKHTKKGRKVVEETKHVDGYIFEATIGVRTFAEEPLQNSRIEFRFCITVLEYLCNRFIMPVNVKMFTINPQKNPHSYNIMRRLTEIYDMNAEAPNQPVRLSVRKLLEHCPEIPKEADVPNRRYHELITMPFERDLTALEETYGLIKWHYCHSKGSPLTDEELAQLSFEDWQNWYIEYYLPDYPVNKAKDLRRRKKEAYKNNP